MMALAAGCTDGGNDATGTEKAEISADGLQPAGTPLRAGLEVPDGAALAGAVFIEPATDFGFGPPADAPDSWEALLVVEGNPFEVWDDLAEQVRSSIGASMAGSADSCIWSFDESAPTVGVDGTPRPERTVEDLDITRTSPDPAVVGIECTASAPVGTGDQGEIIVMTMRQDHRVPPVLSLSSQWQPQRRTEPYAYLSSLQRQAQQDPDQAPVGPPRPEAVDPQTAEVIPDGATQPDPPPRPGDEFGTDVNCFVDSGYSKTTLPEGTEFIAEGWDGGSTTVIGITDDGTSDEAIDALAAQFEGPGEDRPIDETVELDDGTEVRRYEISISAGGGACGVLTSPDGRFLRITRNAD